MKPRRKSRNPPQVRLFQCQNCGRFVPATKMEHKATIRAWNRRAGEDDWV